MRSRGEDKMVKEKALGKQNRKILTGQEENCVKMDWNTESV